MRPQVRVPAPAGLLAAWERGLDATPAGRALLLLAATCPEVAGAALARLPVGRRNRLLIEARALLFGPWCEAVAGCPGCGSELEARLPVGDLVPDPDPDAEDGAVVHELRTAGRRVRYRLPTAGDLDAIARTAGASADTLLRRCVLDVRDDLDGSSPDGHRPDGALPDGVVVALTDALAAQDPDALLAVRLRCPDCGHEAAHGLDPAAFLWAEVDRWAWRLLGEVDELAAAYGWEEAAILALSPWRRQTYVALAAGSRRGAAAVVAR